MTAKVISESPTGRYPWLAARLPELDDEWRRALDDALAEIAALALPTEFRLTDIYSKYNSLRLDWVGAGGVEDAVEAIASALEDKTQGEVGGI